MNRATLYVSGAMAGRPDHGFPDFVDAAARLRMAGYAVISPAELWGEPRPELGRNYLLRADLIAMLAGRSVDGSILDDAAGAADAVAVLPGWEASIGAALETHVARELGMPIRPLGDWLTEAIRDGAHPGEIEQAASLAVREWRQARAS